MKLDSVTRTFKDFAERALGASSGPSRDDIVPELDSLRANEPAYVDVMSPLPPTTGLCAACTEAHQRVVEQRAQYQNHGARVAVLEAQLFRRTYGEDAERDDPGRELANLRAELVRAAEEHHRRCQRWERVVEFDARGRALRAWSTVDALAEVGKVISAIGQQAQALVYRSSAEVSEGIPELRRRLLAAMAMELERPMDIDTAQRAGVRRPAADEAERLGLHPGAHPENVLSGTTRVSRRDSQ